MENNDLLIPVKFIMAVDIEGTWEARASTTMILYQFSKKFPALALDGLKHIKISLNPIFSEKSHKPMPAQSFDLSNPTMHLFHVQQRTIQNSNIHISVLNGALWDLRQLHCGVCELGQL